MHTVTYQKRRNARRLFIAAACLAMWIIAPALAQQRGISTLRGMGQAFARIAEDASDAVVAVQAQRKVPSQQAIPMPQFPFGDDLFERFFGPELPGQQQPQQPRTQTAQGSGFIYSSDGYILTNNHVVKDADKVTVVLTDGREFDAEIVGTDPPSDVALIKIDAKDLPYLELGDSEALRIGEWVLAIGNPFGLSHTVTAGIVSAKGRSNIGLTSYENFIQTDAAINPGNSGGPLINLDGKAVGLSTAILGPGANIGIGLAIPINMAESIAKQLRESGTVTRGYLGVSIQNLDPDLAESFDVETTEGVLVAGVESDSPAEKAGLKRGDVIVEFEGKRIKSISELRNAVAMTKPGTEVEIVILRNGERQEVTTSLAKWSQSKPAGPSRPQILRQLGIDVKQLTSELAERLGYEQQEAVVVTRVQPGSPAAMVGIEAGMLIKEVNRHKVTTVEEFKKRLSAAAEQGRALLLVSDGRADRYVVVKFPDN